MPDQRAGGRIAPMSTLTNCFAFHCDSKNCQSFPLLIPRETLLQLFDYPNNPSIGGGIALLCYRCMHVKQYSLERESAYCRRVAKTVDTRSRFATEVNVYELECVDRQCGSHLPLLLAWTDPTIYTKPPEMIYEEIYCLNGHAIRPDFWDFV